MESEPSKLINISLPLGGKRRGWLIERPALQLPMDRLATLRDDLARIARAGLGGELPDYGVFDLEGDALHRSLVTIVYEGRDAVPVAFNAMPLMDLPLAGGREEVVHLGLVMIDPEARGGGLAALLYGFASFFLLLSRRLRPVTVSSVTQVPAVVGLVSELYSDTYPDGGATQQPTFGQRQIARRIMDHHRDVFGVGGDALFDDRSFIIANAYTGGSDALKKSFATAAKHRKARYNAFCETELDYGRGDDVLQIARLDIAAIRHYFTGRGDGRPILGPLLAVVFFSAQAAIAPLLQWLDNRHTFGTLAPWRSPRTSHDAAHDTTQPSI